MNQITNIIYCKGRYTIHGRTPCIIDFEHIGKWGDEELHAHQEFEEEKDTKTDWWIGFDTDKKFENLKEKVVNIHEEIESRED